jgi:hypothetical protein
MGAFYTMLNTLPDSLLRSLFDLIDGIGLGDEDIKNNSLSLLICELAEIGSYSEEANHSLLSNLDALIV